MILRRRLSNTPLLAYDLRRALLHATAHVDSGTEVDAMCALEKMPQTGEVKQKDSDRDKS